MAAASGVIYVAMVAMETTWFCLIESTKEAALYMCQISNQSDEWC